MLSPYFEKRAIFRKNTIFWLKKLIFHIFQGKRKFRSFQRFSCSFHIRAENSFQSWKNLIFCPYAKHFYTGLVYFLKFSPGWVSKNRFSPGWNIFGVNPPGWEYKGKYWPGWEFWGKYPPGWGKNPPGWFHRNSETGGILFPKCVLPYFYDTSFKRYEKGGNLGGTYNFKIKLL